MGDRPLEVPKDWVRVDCQNPSCDLTVWVPPDLADEINGTKLMRVCSSECAMAITKALG